MKISCLCPTYNRAPHNIHLVAEAVESFLRQDYPDKELIICNDTPGQFLSCLAPGVRVYNLPYRFPTLSAKIIWMIGEATGDALCRWDDDDISLPHRLSYSVRQLGDKLEWHPEEYIYAPRGGPWEAVAGAANTHITALWRREVLEQIGGYPPNLSGIEDQAFNQALVKYGIRQWACHIPHHEIFYVYRWGFSPCHLSGQGGGPQQLQSYYDSLAQRGTQNGTFAVHPHWAADYTALAQGAKRLPRTGAKL